MNKRDLPPSAVVLDLVLKWSDKIGQAGTGTINGGSLTFAVRNHRGDFVMLSTPVHFDGEPDDEAPRFVLRKLGPGVWKLSPSVLDSRLHAYVTLVDVPEPAPWVHGDRVHLTREMLVDLLREVYSIGFDTGVEVEKERS